MSELPAFLLSDAEPEEPPAPPNNGVQTHAALVAQSAIAGWVFDTRNLSRRFVVELCLDGWPVRLAPAQAYVDELARRGIGDGRYGFAFHLSADQAAAAVFADVRLANLGTPVGGLISLQTDPRVETDPAGAGWVDWDGDLLLSGWVHGSRADPPPVIRASIDDQVLVEARADRWVSRPSLYGTRVGRGFQLRLPVELADGRLRHVAVVSENGDILPGSPVPLLVAPGPFDTALPTQGPDAPIARGLSRMHRARGVPFAHLEAWLARFPPAPSTDLHNLVAVAVIGDQDAAVDATVSSLLRQPQDRWVAAAVPTLLSPCDFNPADMLDFLEHQAADCAHVVVVLAGTRLGPDALASFAAALDGESSAVLAYCDLMICDDGNPAFPVAFSVFDYERWLEQGYGALVFAMPRSAALAAVRKGAASTFLLAASFFDCTTPASTPVAHIPLFLASLPRVDPAELSSSLADATRAHLARRGIAAAVDTSTGSLLPSVRVSRLPQPRSISVVIPLQGDADMLAGCLASIAPAVGAMQAEIVIVTNEGAEPSITEIGLGLADRNLQHVVVPGPCQSSRLINEGAAAAAGSLICFLSPRIRAQDDIWLDELNDRLAEATTSCAGALLVGSDGVVGHAGYSLNPDSPTAPVLTDFLATEPGYADLLCAAHEVSALSSNCLMVSREVFDSLEGFDERTFPSTFGDADFCLRARAAGGRSILTPHARLKLIPPAKEGLDLRRERAANAFRARWADILANDPLYNPNLVLGRQSFSGLAWPPRDRSVRLPKAPTARQLPLGY